MKLRDYKAPFIVAVLFFLPFIINNVAYDDDFYKQLWGESHFLQDGRPIAELVLRIFSLSNLSVNNVSPLTWMISAFILGVTCAYASNRLLQSESNIIIASSSFIFCTPSFIENAMFKFDNLTMSIALVVAVLSSLLTIKSIKSFITVSSLCLIYLCCYQLAMTAYAIISLMAFTIRFINRVNAKSNLFDLFMKVLALVSGFAAYTLVRQLMPISQYAMDVSEIAPLYDMLGKIFDGTVKYLDIIRGVYDKMSLIAIILCSLLACIYLAYHVCLSIKEHSNFYSITSSIIIVITVPVSFMMIFAPLAVLNSQPDYLRLLVGLGPFVFMVTSLSLLAAGSTTWLKTVIAIFSVIPMFDAITKSYIVNNAYNAQYKFSDGISIGVMNSLSNSGFPDVYEIKYTLHGSRAYETERIVKEYPFMRKLLRSGFVAIPHWAGYDHQSKVKVGEWDNDKLTELACSGNLVARHINYDIYINKKIAYVDLTKSKCNR